MRYLYSEKNRTKLFFEIQKNANTSWGVIAKKLGVSSRTLQSYRSGTISIPIRVVSLIQKTYQIVFPKPIRVIDEKQIKSRVGKIGARMRYEIYGNPGTKEGRSKGGKQSLVTHGKKENSPFVAREIQIPKQNNDFAELVGIILGDGGMSSRQVHITLHSEDDAEYSLYVIRLIQNVFGISATIKKRKDKKAVVIRISRTSLVKYFGTMGLLPKNKVKYQVSLPQWILENISFRKACIRGLVDTDGCYFVDRHRYKNRVYMSGGINFTNRSLPLLSFFKETLEMLGFHPTQKTAFQVFLRREEEIERYLKEIGTSNRKIQRRFENYYKEKYGRIPKRS